MVASILWPDNAEEIWEALSHRPVPSTRNWIPTGHRLAQLGYAADQTPRELIEEQEEMERLANE